MSRHFKNPLRKLLPKSSDQSTKHFSLLNTFEEALVGRIDKLSHASHEDALKLSWMRRAMAELHGIHLDFKTLLVALELPTSEWKGKWIELHSDNSAKLLEICNAFTSRISELEESHVYIRSALHHLGGSTIISSLDKWKQHAASKSPTIERCFSAIDGLSQTFDPADKSTSSGERILVRAIHGVKAMTIFVCSVLAASFYGSADALRDLQVPDVCMWAKAFVDLQSRVNDEMRRLFSGGKVIVFKELRAVDVAVDELYRALREGVEPVRANLTCDIIKSFEEYSRELVLLLKEVDKFFKVLVMCRNAMS